MEAVVLEGPESLVVRQIPMWPLESYGDGDLVLVEVKACGICGSDLRYFKGENPWAQHTLGRHVDNPPNIVLGHEFTGRVVAVLDEQNAPLLGKRVAPVCSKVCGTCRYCRTGREHLCPHTVHTGHGQGWGERDFYPGAYAEYVPVWGKGCFLLPDALSFRDGAMMDILGVCAHVANQGRVQQAESVLVLGAGPAGNGVARIALIQGASRAVLIDRSARAIEVARQCGFEDVIDTRAGDVEETIRDRLGPDGAMTVFDTIGTEESIALGLRFLDKGGVLVNMAVHDRELRLNQMDLGAERTLVTSCNFTAHEYPAALDWLAEGRIDVGPWTSTIGRSQVPQAFARLLESDKGGEYFKVVIE